MTAPLTVDPSSLRKARVLPSDERPKKPYFVVPLRVHEHSLPVSEAVLVDPFVSVTEPVAGAQLIVTGPSSASPSLSVQVFVVAVDQSVVSETLKCPFG